MLPQMLCKALDLSRPSFMTRDGYTVSCKALSCRICVATAVLQVARSEPVGHLCFPTTLHLPKTC